MGAALPLLALAAYNAALFGSPLRTGYGDAIWHLFTTPFWEGFGGQIWGLRRGLIWCAPLTLLAPLGLIALWRRDRGAAALCLAVPVSQLLFYATWYAWDGAGAWGPRFLNAALPFVALPLAALAADPMARARWLRAAAVALAALTIPVQIGALSINIDQVLTRPGADAPAQTLAHLQLVASRLTRLYERRLAADRLVLWAGFAPSEGRDDTLLPRWTRPEATVIVRTTGAPAVLRLAAQSCWATPAPTSLSLQLNGAAILSAARPCPGRVYRLLLPSGTARLDLTSPGWEPASAAGGQPDRRGVYVSNLTATVDGRPLEIVGDRLPAEGMPIQAAAMRTWLGEVRLPLWDYWWAYLPLLPLPAPVALAIGAGWGGFALACLGVGAALAGREFFGKGKSRS